MDIDKPLKLRPRFRYYADEKKQVLLERLKQLKIEYKSKYRIKISGSHIWIHHHRAQEKIFTPHLHIEMIEDDYDRPDKLLIKGLYSPNSSYWTMFMFLHFILAGLFMAFAIMAYTKSVVNAPFMLYVYLMAIVVLVWIGLYFFARYNRKRGLSQAYELEKVFQEWVKN